MLQKLFLGNFIKMQCRLNKKGISQLVEVAGILVIIVAAIMLVLPQARSAVSSIWQTVTDNAKNFFNSNSGGCIVSNLIQ